MGMSESVAEGPVGNAGEAEEPAGVDTATLGEHPEDQEAEEQLHEVMQAEDPDELKRQLDQARKLAQRHEKTARENSAAARKWREQEDANKSELQREQEARTAAEQELSALRTQQNRMLAAAANDLSPDWIMFLGDGTAEEINDRGSTLVRLIEDEVTRRIESRTSKQIAGNGRPTVRQQTPVDSLRAGAQPSTGANLMGPEQLFRQLVHGEDS